MTRKKTRDEKVRSSYRLQNFKLQVAERAAQRDVDEFGYLAKKYVAKDLSRTLLFSVIVVGLIVGAKVWFAQMGW